VRNGAHHPAAAVGATAGTEVPAVDDVGHRLHRRSARRQGPPRRRRWGGLRWSTGRGSGERVSILIGERPAPQDAGRRGADAARYRRVVVGVDGSPGSRAALIHALAAGARLSTDVEVVTSYARPVFWAGEYPVDPPVPASLRVDTEARLEEFVDEVRRSSAPAGTPGADTVALRLVVSAHPAVEALLDRAGEDDLLVAGDRGGGAPGGALLGSVALDCVNRAVSSVLGRRPPHRRRGGAGRRRAARAGAWCGASGRGAPRRRTDARDRAGSGGPPGRAAQPMPRAHRAARRPALRACSETVVSH